MIISSLSERQTFLNLLFISTPFYGYLKLLEATRKEFLTPGHGHQSQDLSHRRLATDRVLFAEKSVVFALEISPRCLKE